MRSSAGRHFGQPQPAKTHGRRYRAAAKPHTVRTNKKTARRRSLCRASLLTEREIFPQFECAQTKFLYRFAFGLRCRRRAVERERCVRIFLPDRKVVRGDRQPTKCEHVSARFGHSSDLCPGYFVDQVMIDPSAKTDA
jgi:hypothetical protein